MRSREKAHWPSLGHRGWGLPTMGSRQIAQAGTSAGGCKPGSCPDVHSSVPSKVWYVSFQMFLEHTWNILQNRSYTSPQNMDLYGIMLNAISQREKDKYDFTYMWSSKSERNEQT